ncbi:TRAP transporter large permease [bacterium LRH843]|nr:TRAP transporter large permease [bacterium LRH843]
MASILIFLLVLFICLALGIPVFIALGIGAVSIIFYSTGEIPISMLGQKMITGVDSFPLMAIPLFILAGELMNTKSVSGQLIDFTKALIGRLKGGLAMVGIGAGMFFASITGSASAGTAAVGSALFPALNKEGYSKRFSAGIIAASGSIGPIIPPSIPLIIYGVTANESIGQLFVAGYVPGIIMGILFAGIVYYTAKKQNLPEGQRFILKEFVWIGLKTLPAFMLPVIIMGGILLGFFTATESAAVAAGYAFLLSVIIYREISLKELPRVFSRAAISSVVILAVMASASLLSWALTIQQIPQSVSAGLLSLSENKYVLLLLINVILIILGMFLDAISVVIIMTPLFLPIILSIGYDPILFGVMMAVNLSIGVLTPPVGLNLFVASSIGKVSLLEVSKACVPYILCIMVVLVLMTIFPAMFSYLPSLMN